MARLANQMLVSLRLAGPRRAGEESDQTAWVPVPLPEPRELSEGSNNDDNDNLTTIVVELTEQ